MRNCALLWHTCVEVTQDIDPWTNRGASRPAFAGSMSPLCEIFLRNLMAERCGIPGVVNGALEGVPPQALYPVVVGG